MNYLILLNQGGSYFWPIILWVFVSLFLIPLILTIIGFAIKKNRPKAAKTLFICAAAYLIIGLGFCGIAYSI